MRGWLNDPFTLAIVALVAAMSIAFGLLRREPAWAIVGNAVGASALLLGFGLATRLGDDAFLAAAMASGGIALWIEVNHRVVARRTTDHSNA